MSGRTTLPIPMNPMSVNFGDGDSMSLDTGQLGVRATTWRAPPPIFRTLLAEVFSEQPRDVLTWLHTAIWHLRADELGGTGFDIPFRGSATIGAQSSCASQQSRKYCPSFGGTVNGTPMSMEVAMSHLVSVPLEKSDHATDRSPAQRASLTPDIFWLERVRSEQPPTAAGTAAGTAHSYLATHSEPSNHGRIVFKNVSTADSQSSARSTLDSWTISEDGNNHASWLKHFATGRANVGLNSLRKEDSQTPMSLFSDLLDGEEPRVNSYMVSPLSFPRFLWDTAFFFFVVFEIWVTPFALVFMPEEAVPTFEWFDYVSITMLVFFCMDIVFNFFTGYVQDGMIVLERAKVVRKYFTGWFWVDLVSIVPDLVLMLVHNSEGGVGLVRVTRGIKALKTVKALKLVRAIRLIRTQRLANCIMRHFDVGSTFKTVWQLTVLQTALLVLVHTHACIWAALQPGGWKATSDGEAYIQYVTALRWSYDTLTSGYANPSALAGEATLTFGQQVLCTFMAIERVTLALVAMLWAVWLTLLSSECTEYSIMQQGALAYLKRHRVPIEVQLQVFRNLQETSEVRTLQRQFDKLAKETFPLQIRKAIYSELWRVRLLSLGLIFHCANWNDEFIDQLALEVREEILGSKAIVFSTHEASNTAYLVLKGTLLVTFSELEQSHDDYTVGMWVGEKALVNPSLRRSETVICRAKTELMVVPARTFLEIVESLGLTEKFGALLRQKLWLGLCGRCGMLGDHFPTECNKVSRRKTSLTKFQQRVWDVLPRPFWRRRRSRKRSSKKEAAELWRFLCEHKLERLMNAMDKNDIQTLEDMTLSKIEALCNDPEVLLTAEERRVLSDAHITEFKRKIDRANTLILDQSRNDTHLIFISHYKVDAGTEAALMQKDLERLIQEDPASPGHDLKSPIFLDTEDLSDLNQLQGHVRKSHNLVLLLSTGVLTRPWVLIEIVTALKAGVRVVPVEVQRPGMSFEYPNEDYFKRVRNGKELNEQCESMLLEKGGINLRELEQALRQVFARIAVPFSPHKSANIRAAELSDLLANCRMRTIQNRRRTHTGVSKGSGRTLGSMGSMSSNTSTLSMRVTETEVVDSASRSVASTFLIGEKRRLPMKFSI